MATQDEIMEQILKLVSEGAGTALTPDVRAALRARYYMWIAEPSKKVKTSPQDVWEEGAGKDIQERLRYLGGELGKVDAKLQLATKQCEAVCLAVEAASECPHCPDPPTI